jgi:hypothetical protein
MNNSAERCRWAEIQPVLLDLLHASSWTTEADNGITQSSLCCSSPFPHSFSLRGPVLLQDADCGTTRIATIDDALQTHPLNPSRDNGGQGMGDVHPQEDRGCRCAPLSGATVQALLQDSSKAAAGLGYSEAGEVEIPQQQQQQQLMVSYR